MSRSLSSAIGLVLSFSIPAVAQEASLFRVADENTSERKNVVRSLIAMKESEESIFWPLYDQYEQQIKSIPEYSLVSVNVSQFAETPSAEDLASVVSQIFTNQYKNVRLKKDYFEKINVAMNGTIALKFLQSEALTELMQRSKYCELDFGDRLIWDKNFIRDEQLKFERIVALMTPSPEFTEKLRAVFDDFEFEYSRVVGHQFVWFELYVEDPIDLTPAQCRKMGAEFLLQQFNEVKVKERFFQRLAGETDEKFAAGFIMIEDYFNTMAKLELWSDLILATR